MNKVIKAVVFDFDGIIVDSMDAHFRTWQRLAYFLGFTLDDRLKDSMRGKARYKSLQLVLDAGNIKASEEQKKLYEHMKDTWFKLEIEKMTREDVIPGVLPILHSLKNKELKTAVASSSRNASFILEQLQMTALFDCIVDAKTVQTSKPDPEVFIKTLECIDTKAEQSVVIEDSSLGLIAAREAGCFCIGVGSEKLKEYADRYFPEMASLKLDDILHINTEA